MMKHLSDILRESRKINALPITTTQHAQQLTEEYKFEYTVKNGKLPGQKKTPFLEYLQKLPLNSKVPQGKYFKGKTPFRQDIALEDF
ncbi:hypothetical protein MUB04_15100 [Acinetobacter indicus]|uniref:hypothetical protein n=1 Tax=Acinetobacter TaxID=469 RepID=UPI0015D3C914|nr:MULTISPECIES: hypothetical protein [Acinetobacter]MCP0917862.1 hypothetical protein [Acinetobacter indicus]